MEAQPARPHPSPFANLPFIPKIAPVIPFHGGGLDPLL